jgi:hypothetical protein
VVSSVCDTKLVSCAAIAGVSELQPGDGGFVMIRSLTEHFGDEATALARAEEGLEALASSLIRALAGSRASR